MNIITNIFRRIRAIVSCPRFIWFITGLLVVQAVWIALTGKYPMAFDEDFHIGVIKLYAENMGPFWQAHPAGGDAFGALTRDPSYLFHYLMSFPYRFIGLFTDDLETKVLILRFMNIAMFASGIPLYSKLLQRFRASRLTIHVVLLLFVLVPIVPLLAAHVNYDNVILPLTALSLLLALKLSESIKQKQINTLVLLQLLLVCSVSSIIKYAYLPVFMGILVFLAVQLYREKSSPKKIIKQVAVGWHAIEPVKKWLLIAMLLVVAVLFAERYAVNIVRYHTPVPDCGQVLTYNECKSYGPWIRDYNAAQVKPPDTDSNPFWYAKEWFYGMWFRSFFAVDGPTTGFQTRGPLVLPGIGAVVLASLGVVAFIITARRLFARYNASALWLLTSVSVIYVAILWITEYQLYLQTGKAVAINGRYMILLLPAIMLVAALAIKLLVRKIPYAAGVIAVIAVVCFAWGGGALTYILRSNDAWYAQNSPLVSANHQIQRVLKPIVPGGDKPNQFMR